MVYIVVSKYVKYKNDLKTSLGAFINSYEQMLNYKIRKFKSQFPQWKMSRKFPCIRVSKEKKQETTGCNPYLMLSLQGPATQHLNKLGASSESCINHIKKY